MDMVLADKQEWVNWLVNTPYESPNVAKSELEVGADPFYITLLFRGEITPLSSSYNISGLVPVCWLLFQCF